jgi:glycogen debranching enzyme
MTGDLIILDGTTFYVSSRNCDLDASGSTGFFHEDTRHLSEWRLFLDGRRTEAVTSRAIDYYSARTLAIPEASARGEHLTLTVRRDRFVSNGFHEDIVVENQGMERRSVELELRFDVDFADIFEVQNPPIERRGRRRIELGERRVTIRYENGEFRRATSIEFGEPCELARDRAVFEFDLDPKAEWHLCIDVTVLVGDEERAPLLRCDSFGRPEKDMPITFDEWMEQAPSVEADWRELELAYRQGLADLAALRLRPNEQLAWALPAGGLPWFMTLFGRDTILAAYEALPFHAELAQTALKALADYQATERDDFADSEPGKIIHELRRGELAALGIRPGRYYGSHDGTQLFLILLDEYERWTGDVEHVRTLEHAARSAVAWIEDQGDPDGDGYLEYKRRSPQGLENQCWKDSGASMRFADGRPAQPPIATCEVQGYAYDARIRTARLAREVWKDDDLADRLERDAAELRERFNRDFWSEERGHFVLALDGRKRQVDAMTSNVGHLLWSGIVHDERAQSVVERLLADDVWTGWGVRTMSSNDAAYGALEYHNGTVWPHDTAFVAEGMRRYGFRDEAWTLARAVIDAAAHFGYRLPELFAGFPRDEADTPVEYPDANRPQAFAAGAPLLALRTLAGLDVVDGRLAYLLEAPEGVGRVRISGLRPRGREQDVEIAKPSEAAATPSA